MSALLTDLYELAMLQAYYAYDFTKTAVFELFVRKLPAQRGFLLVAGLEQVIEFLEHFQFEEAELEYLRRSERFPDDFVDWLATLRFTGDVDAIPEGTICFPDEPLIRITAPLPQAQLVETRLVNLLHFQTVIATKAARMVLAAPEKLLVDFGLRRAHGAEAALLAARAAYVAGFAGTATVAAEQQFGIPLYGTMAHSFVEAHDDEEVAFEHFARARPEGLVLLIDTYDTEAAAVKTVKLARRLRREGITVRGVRIDSGDLDAQSHRVRAILDVGGLAETIIFVSGGLDETDLARLVRTGAPIDGFGIGTSLTTSSDAPALDCAYKLQEYDGIPRRKLSSGKATWPGPKQVWRRIDDCGTMTRDLIARAGDTRNGIPLLIPVMRTGRRIEPRIALSRVRDRAKENLAQLPPELAGLKHMSYPVDIDPELERLANECDRRIAAMQS